MTTQDTLSGTLFAGRYRIARKLGGGGMADVYLAEDQELGRRVAIKMLHGRYVNDEQFVERFRREASAAAGLQHRHVVSVYDRGAWDGTYYIAMEYLDGRIFTDPRMPDVSPETKREWYALRIHIHAPQTMIIFCT